MIRHLLLKTLVLLHGPYDDFLVTKHSLHRDNFTSYSRWHLPGLVSAHLLCVERPFLFQEVQTYSGPPSLHPEGTVVILELPGCEGDHAPPFSSRAKNAWSYTFTPLYIFLCGA